MALLAVGMGIGFLLPKTGLLYLLGLVLLGILARPFLLWTGLHFHLGALLRQPENRRWRRYTAHRRAEIARRERDAPYRGARKRDPRLPPNW